jgi:uncharacterized protein (TIGR03435 family)
VTLGQAFYIDDSTHERRGTARFGTEWVLPGGGGGREEAVAAVRLTVQSCIYMFKTFIVYAVSVLVPALAASPPAFEIASIRPQPWNNEGRVDVYVRGNTLYGEHADLYRLVDFAYGLRPDDLQLSGGPAWAKHGVLSNVSGGDSLLYQVIARAPEGPPPSVAQFREMLQALLADRFQLRVHHAMKDLAVFRLVTTKDGPKLTESAAGAKDSLALNDCGGKAFRMAAVHVPLSSLVEELAYATGKP